MAEYHLIILNCIVYIHLCTCIFIYVCLYNVCKEYFVYQLPEIFVTPTSLQKTAITQQEVKNFTLYYQETGNIYGAVGRLPVYD